MICEKLNDSWQFGKDGVSSMIDAYMGGGPSYETVTLPHDAMVHEERTPDTANGAQTGFWPGGRYLYIRKLFAPEDWAEKTVMLEFEGVMASSQVYLNNSLAAVQLYGYSDFKVSLDKYLEYGAENEIKVIADTSAEKNTRWYSGSGIYRPVNLLVGARIHIPADGVKITTPSVSEESSLAEISTEVKNITRRTEKVHVVTEILRNGETVGRDDSAVTMFPEEQETVKQRILISPAALWDTEDPNLYQCRVKIVAGNGEVLDDVTETFGFRRLELDAEHGLRINGKTVKLRGTCIHHDNGVIGAATLPDAEERRCRQLKEAGFNSIRSSHNPMSKAMLDACDRYGMLVMDELSDMWTQNKNPNDYALYFTEHMDTEIGRMVAKDFNHPCVILYSSGNEISEIGTPAGAQMNRRICGRFHDLDPSRYTTNAINGTLAAGAKLGQMMQDILKDAAAFMPAQPAPEGGEGQQTGGGSNALNSMNSFMVGPLADAVACHPLMTETLEEACLAMDITGLNYLTGRHELERQLHPNRTVLGTETYPSEIVRLWDIVKRNSHVLGDFTWTGYDYLGEAGFGVFYYDGSQNFGCPYPARASYIGDIDLIGHRRPVSYLREIVYGLRSEPYIAVERVDRYGQPHSQTAWMLKDNIASWTWPGYEGKPANVDVYSPSSEVELFLNGVSLGRQPAGPENGFTASFAVTYEPGELTAVSYENGEETGRDVLRTAGSGIELSAVCENPVLSANGEDLAFVTVTLTDGDGVPNCFAQKEITVRAEGAGTLQGFGSADPTAVGSYDDTTWKTFDGQVMAVIRAGKEAGDITVTFSAEGCRPVTAVITVKE